MIAAPKVTQEYPAQNFKKPVRNNYQRKANPQEKNVVSKVVVCVLLISLFTLGLAFAYFSAQIIAKGQEINTIKRNIEVVQGTNERLLLEKQKMLSLDRIEALAVSELGMMKPSYENLMMVNVAEYETNSGLYSLRNSSNNPEAVSSASEEENNKNIAGTIVAAISNVVNGWAFR